MDFHNSWVELAMTVKWHLINMVAIVFDMTYSNQ